MLHYNFTKLFRLREIERPSTLLRKEGFSTDIAHRIATNKVKALSLEQLEKLCSLLYCTPNDFMEWIPEKEDEAAKKHPLAALREEIKGGDILSRLRKMPLHQLNELQAFMEKTKSAGEKI